MALVAGSVLLLTGLGLGLGGGALAFVDHTQRDAAGFLMSDSTQLATTTYAITSENVVVDSGAPTNLPERMIGDVKVTVHTGPAVPVFVGIASTDDVKAYLGSVEHAVVTDITDRPVYDTSGGTAPAAAPGAQDIWVAQATGTGDQQLVWPVEHGDWTLVLMNADGSRQVVGDVAVGATVPALDWLVPTLLVSAAVVLVLGSLLLVVAFRRTRTPTSGV